MRRWYCFELIRRCRSAKHIQQTHGLMIVSRGLDNDNILFSHFIYACSSLGFFHYAYDTFFRSHNYLYHPPHIYLYNAIIRALVLSHPHPHQPQYPYQYPTDAIFLYHKARAAGLSPDSYTLPFVLKAVALLSSSSPSPSPSLGRKIHAQAITTGLNLHVYVAAQLIRMYSTCGCIPCARNLFDSMPFRDFTCWNAMIAGYAKVGEADLSLSLLQQMPQTQDHTANVVICWTAVIAGYVQSNRPSDAISIFQRMQLEGIQPDEISMLVALSACAQMGALHLGEWIHNYITRNRLPLTLPLTNSLIDMYAKSGNIQKAIEVFDSLEKRSVVTWTTLINGLALHGLGKEALEVFSRMEMTTAGVTPNRVTLIAVLSACSHAGLVEQGRSYFNAMYLRYGIKPDIEHYGCMIDLLARAGCLEEAQQLVREMPFEANSAIWGSLLAASRIHNHVELAEKALQHLIAVEPHNAGNYSQMSNIYASLGWWNEAGMARNLMRRTTGINKVPGWSYIGVGNTLNQFIVGDTSHLQSEMIYNVLHLINTQLKIQRHVLEE